VHTPVLVYQEMMLQVMKDYSVLPDPFNMPLNDIVYFYNGGRATLRDSTKPK
jgi:hypothetical protein